MGEPYRNKPPLQNWLVVLLSGNSASRVGALPLRAISVMSLAGIALLLYALRRRLRSPAVAWLPAIIFVTMGISVQYGSSGEIDPLFSLWITAALAAFEIGRRCASPWLEWSVSQALLAGGILTKGLAPLFFYPPVLYLLWRNHSRSGFSAKAFIVGLVAEGALVGAWVVPYTRRAELGLLLKSLTHQVAQRTPLGQGAGEFLKNILSFPLEVVGSTLPWSLLLFLWLHPAVRRSTRERIGQDPLLRLSAAVTLWAFFLLWFMPGAKGRYFMPALPFLALLLAQTVECSAFVFSKLRPTSGLHRLRTRLRRVFVESWVGWAVLAVLWCAVVLYAGLSASYSVWQPLCAGLLAIVAVGHCVGRRGKVHLLFSGLFLVAVMYAIAYAGFTKVHQAERDGQSVAEADAIASWIQDPLPILCAVDVPYSICYRISQKLDRPVLKTAPAHGRYYLVARDPRGFGDTPVLIGETVTLALWEVESLHSREAGSSSFSESEPPPDPTQADSAGHAGLR